MAGRMEMKSMGKVDTVVFDLDGTLLNTLDDLADSTNYALEQYGFPSRTIEEVRRFVGNGVGKLMERAVPGGADNPRFGEVLDCFKRHYVDHCMVKTGLYPGIADLLARLKAAGVLVRFWDKPVLCDFVRITVGTPAQNDVLVQQLQKILS